MWATGKSAPHMSVEEVGHDLKRFFSFGKWKVIPKSVGQSFEDYEPRIVSGSQESTLQNGGIAQQQIPSAGDQQTGRHAVKGGEQRREYGILSISLADVGVVGKMRGVGR